MVDKKQLEEVYKQNLENDIIIFIIPVNLLNKFQMTVME